MSFGKMAGTFIDIIDPHPTTDAAGFKVPGDTVLASVRAYRGERRGNSKWAKRPHSVRRLQCSGSALNVKRRPVGVLGFGGIILRAVGSRGRMPPCSTLPVGAAVAESRNLSLTA